MTWIYSIPWLLAILGWFAGHAFSEARERRKEVKGMIEKIQERILANEKLAFEFHTSDKFDTAKARTITTNIARIERAILRIEALNGQALEPLIIAYRQAITLRNFDLSEFETKTSDSEFIRDITDSAFDLEDEIDKQYQERYPNRFPYFKWPGAKKFFAFWR